MMCALLTVKCSKIRTFSTTVMIVDDWKKKRKVEYAKPPLQQMHIHFSIRSEYTFSQMSINDSINWNDHFQKHLQMERRRIALVFSHAVSRDRDDSTMNAHYHLKRVKKTLITGKRGKRGQSEQRHNSNARLCLESWVENQTEMSSMSSFLVCENIMLLVL